MKRFSIIAAGILSVCLFFSGCYYISFVHTRKKLEDKKILQSDDTQLWGKEMLMTGADYDSSAPEYEEASSDSLVISSDTMCIYELYYIDTGEYVRYQSSPGADIAGLTRSQLVSWLKEYMDNLSIKEYEEGLVSYNLISFSKDKVVLQKVYDRTRVQYKYFITVRNCEVIVYYSDKKTVFEHTGIRLEPMEVELQHILQKGIPVKDIEELYDFLAAITS